MSSLTPLLEKCTLKVLMADASPNWGGQQYRLLREARWLHQRGYRVVVACGRASILSEKLKQDAPEISVENVRSWGSPSALLRLNGIIRRWKPDLIHTRSGQDSTWAAFFHLAGMPVVRSRHMTVPAHLRFHDAARYRFGCRRIVAVAHFIKKDLIDRVGVPGSRIDVAGEGASLEEFRPGLDGGGFRAEFKIPPESPLFGMIAMMRPEKGHRTFINAAAKVFKSAPGARFVVAGGGGGCYADQLGEKIRRKFPDSPAPLILTGYREDIARVIAALDVVVVPSLHEAQTIVIPQAFASGKPVIASQVGGIPELVAHEQNGLLVPPADHEALSSAMLRLFSDPALRDRLAAAGLRLARSELSFEAKAELVLQAYRKALHEDVAPARLRTPWVTGKGRLLPASDFSG